MEERKHIEYFRGNCSKQQGEVDTFLCPIDNEHSFIGKDVAIKDGFHIVYYLLPFSDGDAILFAVIEETGQLLDAFKGYSNSDLDVLEPSFPKAIKAMRDGANANLTNYAILCLETNGRPFDCVATKISNIDIADLDTEYVIKKAFNLCIYASDIIDELDWDRVSFWQKAKIVAHGVLDSVDTVIKVQKIGNLINNIL